MLRVYSIKDFDRIKNRRDLPEFKKVPSYPTKSDFLKELQKGETDTFHDNLLSFREYRRDLFHFAADIIEDIKSNCGIMPWMIDNYNSGLLANWEILEDYTEYFKQYLDKISINYKSAYVISRSVGTKGLNDPSGRTRKGDFRIVYEYIDGKLIFTNIDYHVYRDSLYSKSR